MLFFEYKIRSFTQFWFSDWYKLQNKQVFFPLLCAYKSKGFMNALYQQNIFLVINTNFEQTKDILLVKLLPGPSMLAGMPILVSVL